MRIHCNGSGWKEGVGVQRDLVANILLFVRESVGKSAPDEGCQPVPLSFLFFFVFFFLASGTTLRDDSPFGSLLLSSDQVFLPFFFLLSLTLTLV